MTLLPILIASIYARAFTNEWFTIEVEAAKSGAAQWRAPAAGEVEVVTSNDVELIRLATDISDPLAYTPTNEGSAVACVNTRFVVKAWAMEPEVADFAGVRGAVAVVKGGEALDFIGLVKGEGGAAWRHFDSVHPVEGELWEVRMEFDNRGAEGKVRYAARRAGEKGYVALHEGWLVSPVAGGKVERIEAAGEGLIGEVGGERVGAKVAMAVSSEVGEVVRMKLATNGEGRVVSELGEVSRWRVHTLSEPMATTYDATSAYTNATAPIDLSLPSSGVKYYQVEFEFTTLE